jgi:hypothetical protein
MSDEMDTAAVEKALSVVLAHQARTVMMLTLLGGTMGGVLGTALKPQLRQFAAAELEDTYLLAEKMSALGGKPRFEMETVEVDSDPAAALEALIEHENSGMAALHEVIPHSGQEPKSEALEHRLEHVIMRKQQQIDYLTHAARGV